MKKRILRCAAALLCACTVLGTGVTCQAETVTAEMVARASGVASGTLTKSKALGLFEYSEVGHQLKVEMQIRQLNKSTGGKTTTVKGNTVWGNNTSVSQTSTAGSGYEYLSMDVYGSVDGAIKGIAWDITP